MFRIVTLLFALCLSPFAAATHLLDDVATSSTGGSAWMYGRSGPGTGAVAGGVSSQSGSVIGNSLTLLPGGGGYTYEKFTNSGSAIGGSMSTSGNAFGHFGGNVWSSGGGVVSIP